MWDTAVLESFNSFSFTTTKIAMRTFTTVSVYPFLPSPRETRSSTLAASTS